MHTVRGHKLNIFEIIIHVHLLSDLHGREIINDQETSQRINNWKLDHIGTY